MSRAGRWIAVACVVAVLPSLIYIAAGGRDYRPSATPDPCLPRDWPKVSGTTQILEQAAISTLDGAACKLHVSSETLAIAFGSKGGLDKFAKDHGFSQSEIDDAARDGLLRAVDDGQRSGEIGTIEAFALKLAAQVAPVDRVLQLVQDQLLG